MLIGDRKKFLSCLVTLKVEVRPDFSGVYIFLKIIPPPYFLLKIIFHQKYGVFRVLFDEEGKISKFLVKSMKKDKKNLHFNVPVFFFPKSSIKRFSILKNDNSFYQYKFNKDFIGDTAN